MNSYAQAVRKNPERVKREFKKALDQISKDPEFRSLIKRIDDAGDAEQKIRNLLQGFVSFDDPYSMDLLNVYTQTHFSCSAKEFIWKTHVIDACAHLDFKLSERQRNAQALADALREVYTSVPPS